MSRKGVVFDVYGTIVLTDCIAENYYKRRRGFLKVLKTAKRRRYSIGFFGDDDKVTIDAVLAKIGIKGYERHYGNELDEDGLKRLPLFKFDKQVYIGDMPRDARAAEKYQIPFIKVPPFVIKQDKFDLSIAFELAEAIIENKVEKFAAKYRLKKMKDSYTNKNLRIRINKVISAQFF